MMKKSNNNASLFGANFQRGGVLLRRFKGNRIIAILLSLILIITSIMTGTVSVSANNSTDSKGSVVNIEDVATVMPDGYLLSDSYDNLMRLKFIEGNATVTINDDSITKETLGYGANATVYCWQVSTFDEVTLTNPFSMYYQLPPTKVGGLCGSL